MNAAGERTWFNWTQYPDHGPDESVLGDVRGKAVLDLGSGSGANLAHLVTLGARGIGVDIAPARAVAARRLWPGGNFVTADATDYLANTANRFNVVYSVFGPVWFTDPATFLPLVHDRLDPGGVLAFSHLPTATDHRRAVRTWHLAPEQWSSLLRDHGFRSPTATVIPGPRPENVGTLLVRAEH